MAFIFSSDAESDRNPEFGFSSSLENFMRGTLQISEAAVDLLCQVVPGEVETVALQNTEISRPAAAVLAESGVTAEAAPAPVLAVAETAPVRPEAVSQPVVQSAYPVISDEKPANVAADEALAKVYQLHDRIARGEAA
jgi:hypothetical protein